MNEKEKLEMIENLGKGRIIDKLFTKEEFKSLLIEATDECYNYVTEKYCVGGLPKSYKYFIRGSDYKYKVNESGNVLINEKDLYETDDLIPLILREDGYHRSGLHIYLFGVLDKFTVFEVIGSIYGWKKSLLIDNPIYPNPVFIVCGPSIGKVYNQDLSIKEFNLAKLSFE